jgi:hypothetical protein
MTRAGMPASSSHVRRCGGSRGRRAGRPPPIGVLGGWRVGPSLGVRIDGGDVGRHELGQGAIDGDPCGGAALGAEVGGELGGATRGPPSWSTLGRDAVGPVRAEDHGQVGAAGLAASPRWPPRGCERRPEWPATTSRGAPRRRRPRPAARLAASPGGRIAGCPRTALERAPVRRDRKGPNGPPRLGGGASLPSSSPVRRSASEFPASAGFLRAQRPATSERAPKLVAAGATAQSTGRRPDGPHSEGRSALLGQAPEWPNVNDGGGRGVAMTRRSPMHPRGW